MPEEAHYRLLRLLYDEPRLTQRELAQRMGVSLGKVNYCLKALTCKGWIKVNKFYRSRNKRAYFYKLTPSGIAGKARLTRRFLDAKKREYEVLRTEIEVLSREVSEGQEPPKLRKVGRETKR